MELIMKTIMMLSLIWKVFPSTQLKMKINQNIHPQQTVNLYIFENLGGKAVMIQQR